MPSDFPTLQLATGGKLFADEIHIGYTYALLLDGVPSDEVNQHILNGLPERMRRIFYKAPVYVLPPEIELRTEPHPLRGSHEVPTMPPVELAVRFISYEPLTAEGHAAQLVVVWHQHTMTPLIADSARLRLEHLNWKDTAKDFCY